VTQRGDEAERLRRLQRVTDAALAHLSLDELLAALLARTKEALDVDTCAILLLDESANELVACAAIGIEEEVERGVRIPVGAGFAGKIVAELRPIELQEVDERHAVNPILWEKGIEALLGVPLVVEGRPVGVLHVGVFEGRPFTKDEVEFLQAVGDRAALAIDHARTFAAERALRLRLENMQSVTDAALGLLGLDELLEQLLLRIRDILEADTCAFLLLDAETMELVARAAVGIEEEVEQGVRIPVGRGFAGRIAAEGRPVVLEDVDLSEMLNPLLQQKGIRSLLGVPLFVRGEVIGVVHVGTLAPRAFAETDVELLQLVADRAALAIERARVHDEMIRLDEMKLNFVAVASHELRTPAAAVYGILATLRGRGRELTPEQRAELDDTLWEQTDRLRLLIEQLLDLSRLDAHAVPLEPRAVEVRELVESVVEGVGGGGRVELDVDPGLEAVVDPLVVDRVLSNLLVNAFRYGAPPVTVRADRRDRHLRFTVEDQGEGVPAELVPRLFDRFEHGEEGKGAGLGLAIARAYADAHGGTLVYDRGVHGARFELLLPGS
jgi:signal transduction histidine kinase